MDELSRSESLSPRTIGDLLVVLVSDWLALFHVFHKSSQGTVTEGGALNDANSPRIANVSLETFKQAWRQLRFSVVHWSYDPAVSQQAHNLLAISALLSLLDEPRMLRGQDINSNGWVISSLAHWNIAVIYGLYCFWGSDPNGRGLSVQCADLKSLCAAVSRIAAELPPEVRSDASHCMHIMLTQNALVPIYNTVEYACNIENANNNEPIHNFKQLIQACTVSGVFQHLEIQREGALSLYATLRRQMQSPEGITRDHIHNEVPRAGCDRDMPANVQPPIVTPIPVQPQPYRRSIAMQPHNDNGHTDQLSDYDTEMFSRRWNKLAKKLLKLAGKKQAYRLNWQPFLSIQSQSSHNINVDSATVIINDDPTQFGLPDVDSSTQFSDDANIELLRAMDPLALLLQLEQQLFGFGVGQTPTSEEGEHTVTSKSARKHRSKRTMQASSKEIPNSATETRKGAQSSSHSANEDDDEDEDDDFDSDVDVQLMRAMDPMALLLQLERITDTVSYSLPLSSTSDAWMNVPESLIIPSEVTIARDVKKVRKKSVRFASADPIDDLVVARTGNQSASTSIAGKQKRPRTRTTKVDNPPKQRKCQGNSNDDDTPYKQLSPMDILMQLEQNLI